MKARVPLRIRTGQYSLRNRLAPHLARGLKAFPAASLTAFSDAYSGFSPISCRTATITSVWRLKRALVASAEAME
jgi:hypothetical protein